MESGKFYHIYNRGNNRETIFKEVKNYYFFIRNFQNYLQNYIDIFSYCLMPNHFHFLIKIKEFDMNETKGNLNIIDKSFKDFFIKYSKTINKNYNRTGALFQQKFKKKEINKSDYLIRLIPYIHNNPVRAKLCEKPEEWKFSSYQYIIKNKFNNQVISELMDLFGDIDTFKQIHIQYSSYQNERNFLFKE